MEENKFLVTKNGLIHNCKTEERYNSFINAGWKGYVPSKSAKSKRSTKDK